MLRLCGTAMGQSLHQLIFYTGKLLDVGLDLRPVLGQLLQLLFRCFHLVCANLSDLFTLLAACFEFGDLATQVVECGFTLHTFGAELLEVRQGLIPVGGKSFQLMSGGGFILAELQQVGGFLFVLSVETLQ